MAEIETEGLMVLARVDIDPAVEGETTPPVERGTFVGAVIEGDEAWYFHPQTGEPWFSKPGDYTIMEEGGAL